MCDAVIFRLLLFFLVGQQKSFRVLFVVAYLCETVGWRRSLLNLLASGSKKEKKKSHHQMPKKQLFRRIIQNVACRSKRSTERLPNGAHSLTVGLTAAAAAANQPMEGTRQEGSTG